VYLEPLDDRRNPLAEVDAQGAQTVPQALSLQLVGEGRDEARAARAERMTGNKHCRNLDGVCCSNPSNAELGSDASVL